MIDEGLDHISTIPAKIAKKAILDDVSSFIDEMIKSLEHHKDTTVGLWATDIEPEDKTNFFQIEYK